MELHAKWGALYNSQRSWNGETEMLGLDVMNIQALNPFPGMILACTTLSLHRICKTGVEFDGITM